ncbi:hypothetical protein VTI74DRAFT_2839 [Chaetomium olivicolor]
MAEPPARHVALSLSAYRSPGPDVPLPERMIFLSRGADSVTVGRSSKVSSKGFLAGPDNAWFDSPLMSRFHARIVADIDRKKVEIKDLGSLHGTYVNGSDRIPTGKSRELKDGDTLRFGVPIWRGTEQFIPTMVRVGIRFAGVDSKELSQRTNIFRVPDGSDDDASDSSDSDNMQKSRKSIRTLQTRAVGLPGSNIIDLTAHGQGDRQIREVIDLSSPVGSPIRIEDDGDESASVMESTHGNLENHEDAQPAISGPREPVRFGNADNSADRFQGDDLNVDAGPKDSLDTDEESERYTDQDDADIDSPETDSEGEIDYAEEESDSQLDEYDEGRDSYDEEMDSYDWEERYSTDYDSVGLEDTGGMDWEESYTSDDDSLAWDKPHESDDGHLTFGDHNEGNRAFRDYQAPEAYPEISPLVESLSGRTEPAAVSKTKEERPKAPFTIEGMLNSEPATDPVHATSTGSSFREPSPLKGFPTLPATPSLTGAQILGAKAGKADFFLAREANKMTLMAMKAADTAVRTSGGFEPFDFSKEHHTCSPEQASIVENGAWHAVVGDLNEPNLWIESPLISPPPDKDSQPAAFPVGLTRRTHVGISDILEAPEPRHHDPKLKRKADDISKTTEEQEKWAAESKNPDAPSQDLAVSPSDAAKETEGLAHDHVSKLLCGDRSASERDQRQGQEQALSTESEGQATSDAPADVIAEKPTRAASPPPSKPERIITITVPETDERPTKRARLMRVAERLGYAALGGVTTSAVVLGTLIYTAPTFG